MKPATIAPFLLRLFTLNSIIVITLRIIETVAIGVNFNLSVSIVLHEAAGLFFDLALTSLFITISFILLISTSLFSKESVSRTISTGIILFTVFHYLILSYFIYQLVPLDIFLYQYSLNEILFTIKTSDSSSYLMIISFIVLIVITWKGHTYTAKYIKSNKSKKITYTILTISLITCLATIVFDGFYRNKFTTNKSLFFYKRSVEYFLGKDANQGISRHKIEQYHQINSEHTYVNEEYPLLHKFDSNNVLKPFLTEFDSAPNIVLLIVEGLSDEYLHPYKGVNLMPFLSGLKDSSLYWSRCFTLGERSFAAVPGITGSLPYGVKGFTLLNILPRHYTLVSILKHNGYNTSFFYGQDRWFHKKSTFFKYNNIDLVFDKNEFSDEFSKVIASKNNYFWGYNDKDLFAQSLSVLDTLTTQKRLDLYFTGTSHSPFAITEDSIYTERYEYLIEKLKTREGIKFFKTYSKYLKSLLFVDDALEEFITNYKNRPEFKNTLFIITGDHPVTEIPISNSLKRYHVPLIFYSDKVKEGKDFKQIVSHLDIYETLLSLLNSYDIRIPKNSTALGGKLIYETNASNKKLAFMNDNRNIIDYYSNGFYLSDGILFKVKDDLTLIPIKNKTVQEELQHELAVFKQISLNTSLDDRILPDSNYFTFFNKNVFYSNRDKTHYKSDNEFQPIIASREITNCEFIFDVSFEINTHADKNTSIVYQLSTKNDSIVYWRNAGLGKNSFQLRSEIPKMDLNDSILLFKSFIWNINNNKLSYENLKIDLYSVE